MRAWCVIGAALVAMGCSGEPGPELAADSGSPTYPTSDASGLAAEADDSAASSPEDVSVPTPDVAMPAPDASDVEAPSPAADVPVVDDGSASGPPDVEPPAPQPDATAPDADPKDDAVAGDAAGAPDGTEPGEPAACLELLSCNVSCPAGDSACKTACQDTAGPATMAQAEAVRTCRNQHCGGLGGPSGVLCTIGECTCESVSCGACDMGCEATGAASCDEVVSCLFGCGLTDTDLVTAIENTCCFTDCRAQGSASAQGALDVCIGCIRDTCEAGADLIGCATGPCAGDCSVCTPG